MVLISPQYCGRLSQRFHFCDFTCHYKLIDWLQGNNINRFDPRGTKTHWVHTQKCFDWLQGNNLNIVVLRGNKAYWVHPLIFYRPQGNNIEIFGPRGTNTHWDHSSHIFDWLQGKNIKIVIPREKISTEFIPHSF